MKGILSKITIILCVLSMGLSSFAMQHNDGDQDRQQDPLARMEKVAHANMQAAGAMAQATSTETAAKNAVVGAAGGMLATPVLTYVWDYAKGLGSSALSAMRSVSAGISGYIADSSIVQNNPTAALYAKTAGKYALGLGALYLGYQGIRSVYNMATASGEDQVEQATNQKEAPKEIMPVAQQPQENNPANAATIKPKGKVPVLGGTASQLFKKNSEQDALEVIDVQSTIALLDQLKKDLASSSIEKYTHKYAQRIAQDPMLNRYGYNHTAKALMCAGDIDTIAYSAVIAMQLNALDKASVENVSNAKAICVKTIAVIEKELRYFEQEQRKIAQAIMRFKGSKK